MEAVIAGSVNLIRFASALAQAGLVCRQDGDRLIIEPVGAASRAMATCATTSTRRRLREALEALSGPERSPAEALVGMAWWNGLTRTERARWLEIAGSARPADAWRAFQAGGKQS